MTSADGTSVETVLRDELARADRALSSVAPVLGHILVNSGHALVSDAVVARVRGMLNDLARQFAARLPVEGLAAEAETADPVDTLAQRFAQDAPMLASLHAAAIEGILTERLEQRTGIDPVLSPLWQELIASTDPMTGEAAMQALAAQSRFMQSQRRMQIPASDLAPETLERALRIWARGMPLEQEPKATEAMRHFKADYDEAATRTGLLYRLTVRMGAGAIAALELEHSGLALFASALAHLSGQSRERAVLACFDRQSARLALSLRAAGLDALGVERQFLTLGPGERLPRGLADLSTQSARAMLQSSQLAVSEAGPR
ncbi:MAG: hypothetical protein AAFZ11_09500 [Pseudomonadota bacterium]